MPGVPNGQGSFTAVAQQTAWGGSIVTTGLKTFPNLGGDTLTGQAGIAARQSIATAMPSIDQTYGTMSLIPVGLNFEFVADDTAYKPLLLAAFGKRVVSLISGSDYKDNYYVQNPPVDGGTDSAPNFFNHSLSWHEILSDGSTVVAKYQVGSVVITQFELAGEANGTLKMTFQGTGTALAASSWGSPVFTDQAGKIPSWNDAIFASPKGIFLDSANPPTTQYIMRSFRFVLNTPIDFHPRLGAAAAGEIAPPTRAGIPTARISVTQDFTDETSGADAVSIMTDFIARTRRGIQISYYPDIDNYIKLNAFGATAPLGINNAKINRGNNGPVGFTVDYDVYPKVITDLSLELATASNT